MEKINYKLNNSLTNLKNRILSNAVCIKSEANTLSSGNVAHHKVAIYRHAKSITSDIKEFVKHWKLISNMLVFFSSHEDLRKQFEKWCEENNRC